MSKGNLYEAIKEYESNVDYWNLQVCYHEGLWMIDGDEVSFTEGCREELLEGMGDTYGGCLKAAERGEKYTAILIDQHCGRGYETIFFLNEMEIVDD